MTVSIKINSNDDKHAKTASLKPSISYLLHTIKICQRKAGSRNV